MPKNWRRTTSIAAVSGPFLILSAEYFLATQRLRLLLNQVIQSANPNPAQFICFAVDTTRRQSADPPDISGQVIDFPTTSIAGGNTGSPRMNYLATVGEIISVTGAVLGPVTNFPVTIL